MKTIIRLAAHRVLNAIDIAGLAALTALSTAGHSTLGWVVLGVALVTSAVAEHVSGNRP